jgi:hypothetical protein
VTWRLRKSQIFVPAAKNRNRRDDLSVGCPNLGRLAHSRTVGCGRAADAPGLPVCVDIFMEHKMNILEFD